MQAQLCIVCFILGVSTPPLKFAQWVNYKNWLTVRQGNTSKLVKMYFLGSLPKGGSGGRCLRVKGYCSYAHLCLRVGRVIL